MTALPALVTLVLDIARRGGRLAALDRDHAVGYVASVLVSLVAWGALLQLVRVLGPRWRLVPAALFVVAFGLATGVQAAFFAHYDVYLALDAQLDAESIAWALVGTLPLDGTLFLALGLSFAIATLIALLALRSPARRGWAWSVAVPLLVIVPTSYRGVQSSPSDLLYFHALRAAVAAHASEALGGPLRPARMQRRAPPPRLPRPPRSMPRRNVLLVVQEAVRADRMCPRPGEPCALPTSPTHELTPARFPLREMRAVSSSTAIALTTLWSGLSPAAPRDALRAAPLVWDHAAAAGYRTGYWTSQHGMFANTRLLVQGAALDRVAWATHLDPLADYLIGAPDELASERALADLERLGEPFFGVVHYSNVHMPRRVDPARAPYRPTDLSFRRANDEMARHYYENAVYLSELAVARLVEGVRAAPYGPRTILFYVSDHGEALLEHAQDNDHGSTLFDEEIRAAAWIDAPDGTLEAEEIAALRSASDAPIFQTAVFPTLLDLLGVWDGLGAPLTRGHDPSPAILTNVSWAWEYGDPNWGLMQGSRKLFARSTDAAYLCFDLSADPQERNDLGEAACGDLAPRAREVFGGILPRDLGRLREHPSWGR